jgi:hypothetical protein
LFGFACSIIFVPVLSLVLNLMGATLRRRRAAAIGRSPDLFPPRPAATIDDCRTCRGMTRSNRNLMLAATLALLGALALAGVGSAAETSPRLLLQGPGWRVQHAGEERGREGIHGSVEFVTGKPIPYETIDYKGDSKHPTESGMFPPAVRQRRVELRWRKGSLSEAIAAQRAGVHPHGQEWLQLPVLDTTAQVDARAEFFANLGGPGDREMKAFWEEDGYVIELEAAVPDQAAFEERLAWVTKADDATWLAAMPKTVVVPAEHDRAVGEALVGIPTPKTFKRSRVPGSEGLTTARYQVGAKVTATVACLWFRQWGAAQRSGDTAAERQAEDAMATSKHWAVLHEMAREGAFPEVIWTLAKEMPSGVWEWNGKTHPLLPKAEALGCARLGIPLLPAKMKLQRERGKPAPPA